MTSENIHRLDSPVQNIIPKFIFKFSINWNSFIPKRALMAAFLLPRHQVMKFYPILLEYISIFLPNQKLDKSNVCVQ